SRRRHTRFSRDWSSDVCSSDLRLEWGPDGSLYAAGLGGSQDFGHQGHTFGLQRLTYNGRLPFEMLAIRAKSNGLEVEFTKPLRRSEERRVGKESRSRYRSKQ